MTGIATAQMDSVPMVAITGQVARPAIGKDAFQETDVTGITLPVTKHNYLVMTPEEIAPTIKEAFLHRQHRPARPRARGHTQGRVPGGRRSSPTRRRSTCPATSR